MREAYRIHQKLWDNEKNRMGFEAVLMYTGHPGDVPQFSTIEPAIHSLMKKVAIRTA